MLLKGVLTVFCCIRWDKLLRLALIAGTPAGPEGQQTVVIYVRRMA